MTIDSAKGLYTYYNIKLTKSIQNIYSYDRKDTIILKIYDYLNGFIGLDEDVKQEAMANIISKGEDNLKETLKTGIMVRRQVGIILERLDKKEKDIIGIDKSIEGEEIDNILFKKELSSVIGELLGSLTEREQFVLKYRFGLNSESVKTFASIGELLNISTERVRQIEAKALRKLRHPSRSKRIRDYFEVSGYDTLVWKEEHKVKRKQWKKVNTSSMQSGLEEELERLEVERKQRLRDDELRRENQLNTILNDISKRKPKKMKITKINKNKSEGNSSNIDMDTILSQNGLISEKEVQLIELILQMARVQRTDNEVRQKRLKKIIDKKLEEIYLK
jgi:RNA polymerase sigma factor (sigma-70 family)